MHATITMRSGKKMVFELYPQNAPITVKNFSQLCQKKFYDGLSFHRVVQGYVIQGGSEDNTCMCPTDFTIEGEFAANGHDTGLSHSRGALSMARDDDFNSAGTQFFVVHQDAHKLNGKYAAFGMLVDGFDVLDQIASVPTDTPEQENRPFEEQTIQSIRVSDER